MAFLIPFIPWIIGALLSAGAVVVLAEQLKGASGKTLAVIGERKSGKTTFTRLLSQGIVGSEDYSETVVDTMYKGSKIRLKDDTVLHVGDLKDLPGDQSAWLPWKNRVNESDHVLYLVRSHLLRSGQGTARDRCRRDLQQLELWLREIKDKGAKVPTVVLIFSFRDRDSEQGSDPISYGQDLIKLGGLEQVVEELRRITRVALVAGSLDSEEAATSLLEQIGHSL